MNKCHAYLLVIDEVTEKSLKIYHANILQRNLSHGIILPIRIILLDVIKSLIDNTLLNIADIQDLLGANCVRSDLVNVAFKISEHTSIINRRTVSSTSITDQELPNRNVKITQIIIQKLQNSSSRVIQHSNTLSMLSLKMYTHRNV